MVMLKKHIYKAMLERLLDVAIKDIVHIQEKKTLDVSFEAKSVLVKIVHFYIGIYVYCRLLLRNAVRCSSLVAFPYCLNHTNTEDCGVLRTNIMQYRL